MLRNLNPKVCDRCWQCEAAATLDAQRSVVASSAHMCDMHETSVQPKREDMLSQSHIFLLTLNRLTPLFLINSCVEHMKSAVTTKTSGQAREDTR